MPILTLGKQVLLCMYLLSFSTPTTICIVTWKPHNRLKNKNIFIMKYNYEIFLKSTTYDYAKCATNV